MRPVWLDAWLGASPEELDAVRLASALEAARVIVDRLGQQAQRPMSEKGQADLAVVLAEWQAAMAVLRARAADLPRGAASEQAPETRSP